MTSEPSISSQCFSLRTLLAISFVTLALISIAEWLLSDIKSPLPDEARTMAHSPDTVPDTFASANEPSGQPPTTTKGIELSAGAAGSTVEATELWRKARPFEYSNERVEAIVALGHSDDPMAVLTLRSLLDDPNPLIRQEVVESLGEIGGPSAVSGLNHALLDVDVIVRRLAIEMLAQLATEDAIDALALTLNEHDSDLRMLAADEIADIDQTSSRILLQRFLSDDDPRVRRLAADRLSLAELEN